MSPPPVRWWQVRVNVFGQQMMMDTCDPSKIGPWLCDIVNSFRLDPQTTSGLPIEMSVSIT